MEAITFFFFSGTDLSAQEELLLVHCLWFGSLWWFLCKHWAYGARGHQSSIQTNCVWQLVETINKKRLRRNARKNKRFGHTLSTREWEKDWHWMKEWQGKSAKTWEIERAPPLGFSSTPGEWRWRGKRKTHHINSSVCPGTFFKADLSGPTFVSNCLSQQWGV